jgi:spore germination cell wall hydrolase CwlJ-like protein
LSVISESGVAAPSQRNLSAAARAGLKVSAFAVVALASCFAIRAALVRDNIGSRVHTLVEAGNGDISDAELTALMADAGPGALHIASSHDPDAPIAGLGRPPAWKRLEVTSPPKLWLGKLSMQEAEQVNGVIPDAQVANPPADPFVLRASAAEKAAALQCLTAAIYYEAALEPREGQEAVAQVVLNRMRHPGYPKSVCGVVFQGSDRPGCQFSFACDGSMARPPAQWAWRNARDVAEQALDGFVMKLVGTATHYHTSWVMAAWTPTLLKVAQIGAHIFFRPLGPEGDPSAFRARYVGGEAAASKVDLIGKATAATAAPTALMRVSAAGSTVAPRSVVVGGRTIVMPAGTVFLSNIRPPGATPALAVPPMHAMITLRAAAARAAMATAAPAEALADAAETVVPPPAPKPMPPQPKAVAGPNGFSTLPSGSGGG